MKKIIMYSIIAMAMLGFAPVAQASISDTTATNTSGLTASVDTPMPLEAQILLGRLDEINAMDKSNLTREEKRALRKEVKSTEQQLRDLSGGVYISAGAVIIILLLLIIFL